MKVFYNIFCTVFWQNTYYGNVTENGTSGLKIITMKANDYDDHNEGSNAQLLYNIEDIVSDENGNPLFTIDQDSGIIRTAICCLDREKHQNHLIHVVAIDGGGLRGKDCYKNSNFHYSFSAYGSLKMTNIFSIIDCDIICSKCKRDLSSLFISWFL